MESEELKSCPFCGKVPEIETGITVSKVKTYRATHYCTTLKTHIVTPRYRTEKDATDVWNHRT
jgi:hypothetical protein